MRLLMERHSGNVVRIRLVAYRAGHAVIYENTASGLTALGLTSVLDINQAVRVFDRAVELAEADMLRHPAWKPRQEWAGSHGPSGVTACAGLATPMRPNQEEQGS